MLFNFYVTYISWFLRSSSNMDIGSNRDMLMDNMVWFSKNKILIKNKILLWIKLGL